MLEIFDLSVEMSKDHTENEQAKVDNVLEVHLHDEACKYMYYDYTRVIDPIYLIEFKEYRYNFSSACVNSQRGVITFWRSRLD